MDSQFDESGDSLIAQMDSQPIEMIEPSLKWPHLLKHPKFIGSYIQITSQSKTEGTPDEVYKARVSKIAHSSDNQLALALTNISILGRKSMLETWTIPYDSIVSVHLIDTDLTQEQIDDLTEAENEVDLLTPSPETSVHLSETKMPTPAPLPIEPVRINAHLPFLQNGKVDLFYLKQIHLLEQTPLTFYAWTQSNGIAYIMDNYHYVFDTPMCYGTKNDSTLDPLLIRPGDKYELLRIRNEWENSFPDHRLSFDIWYPLIGYKSCVCPQNDVKTYVATLEAQTADSNKVNIESVNMSINHNQDENNSLLCNESEMSFQISDDVDLSTLDECDKILVKPSELYMSHLQIMHSIFLDTQGWFNLDSKDWVHKALNFDINDFLLGGKFAWLYLPSYLYIPQALFTELRLVDLDEESRHIMWLKLNFILNKANELITRTTPENYIITSVEEMSPWHVYTSKKYNHVSKVNVIDHIQHVAAWKRFNEHKNLRKFTKKDIYDLFVRPLERMFSFDSNLSQQLFSSATDVTARNAIFDRVISLIGFESYKDDYFDAHYLLHKLSKIRHLSRDQLANNAKERSGPFTQILQFNVFEPNEFDIEFEPIIFGQIHRFLENYIKESFQNGKVLNNEPFPLTPKFLDVITPFGGRNINLSNQQTIQKMFNDLIKQNTKQATEKQENKSKKHFQTKRVSSSSLSSESNVSFRHSSPIPKNRTKNSSLETKRPVYVAFTPSPLSPSLIAQDAQSQEFYFDSSFIEQNRENFNASTAKLVCEGKSFVPKTVDNVSSGKDFSRHKDFHYALPFDDNASTHDPVCTQRSVCANTHESHYRASPIPMNLGARKKDSNCANTPTIFSFSPSSSSLSSDQYVLNELFHEPSFSNDGDFVKNDFDNFSFSNWQSDFTTLIEKIDKPSSKMFKAFQQRQQQPSATAGAGRIPYSIALTAPPPSSVGSSSSVLGNPQDKPLRQRAERQQDDPRAVFDPNWSDNINQGTSVSDPRDARQSVPYQPPQRGQITNRIPYQQMWRDQQRYRVPMMINPSAQQRPKSFVPPQRQQQFRMPSFYPSKRQQPNAVYAQPAIQEVRTTPKGKLNSTIYPWLISKRQTDRQLQDRMTNTVPITELERMLHFPCPKEPYASAFWSTTDHLAKVPTWAKIPHSAHSLAMVIEQDPVTPLSHPSRFEDTAKVCRFPLDDTLLEREIKFSYVQKSVFYLQITETITFPDQSTDDSIVFIEWTKIDKFLDKLGQLLRTPLPPAT